MRLGQRIRSPNPCACGCGKLAPILYCKNGPRKGNVRCYARFIPGHGNKDWGRRMKLRPAGETNQRPIGSVKLHWSTPKLPYRLIKAGPGRKGWRYEHRVVMEDYLGRPLLRSEHVHHKDHDTLNNVVENLELMTHSEHSHHHNSIDRWSKDFANCKECGTTKREHEGLGLCTACYQRLRYRLGLVPKRKH